VTLHVHEWGRRGEPPVFCLHGVTAWGGRFKRLAEERLDGYHVLAPDLRGHGDSVWEPPWSLDTHVDDLIETLDALRLRSVDLVGHSFGGRLGLELAARQPGRVDRLVLLDPAVWVPPAIALEQAELALVDRSFASVEEAIEARLAANPEADRAILAQDVPRQLQLGDDGRWRPRLCRAAVVAGYGEMAKQPPLDRLEARTLLVRGRDSRVVPDELVAIVLAALPHCEVVTVPGGHNVLWDAFDETASALRAFLQNARA
jgi:lipase